MLLKHYLDQGVSQSELARRFGIDRTTIWRWVRTGQLDRDLSAGSNGYSPRPPVTRKLDPYKAIIDARLEEFPKLSAKRLFDEVRAGGNPGLVSGDRAMLLQLRWARRDAFLERLARSAGDWVPDVRRLRPDMPWQDVLAIVNSRLPETRRWTLQRLMRAAKAYVAEGFLPETVLERASGRRKDDRLPVLVAAMRAARPDVCRVSH